MTDTLFLRPSLQFTTLHSTSLDLSTLHFLPFKLHPHTLHYPLIWLKPIQISYSSISPHVTTLHLTSLHCTFSQFSSQYYSLCFIPLIIAFLTFFLKILGLKGKVPNSCVYTCLYRSQSMYLEEDTKIPATTSFLLNYALLEDI